jgi:hypothetical protein
VLMSGPGHTKSKGKVKVQQDKECNAKMQGVHVNVWPRAHTKRKRNVKVQEEKDCTANMGKCAEVIPVELPQACVIDPNHFSPGELAEMGKWSEKRQVN